MSSRSVALALLVAGAVALAIGVVKIVGAADDPEAPPGTGPVAISLQHASPATAPFRGLTEARVDVGGRCLRVAVADSLAEREAGLRGRSDLGLYDGMLFVFEVPTGVAFTMSGVPVPLEIGFYRRDGARNSVRHMKPCPKVEAECPLYRASSEFVYALETLKGKLPAGAVAGCR